MFGECIIGVICQFSVWSDWSWILIRVRVSFKSLEFPISSHADVCCVFFTNRSFYRSTFSTTSVRADSSILLLILISIIERCKLCAHNTTPHREILLDVSWYAVSRVSRRGHGVWLLIEQALKMANGPLLFYSACWYIYTIVIVLLHCVRTLGSQCVYLWFRCAVCRKKTAHAYFMWHDAIQMRYIYRQYHIHVKKIYYHWGP